MYLLSWKLIFAGIYLRSTAFRENKFSQKLIPAKISAFRVLHSSPKKKGSGTTNFYEKGPGTKD